MSAKRLTGTVVKIRSAIETTAGAQTFEVMR
jgi:hypothetical protein